MPSEFTAKIVPILAFAIGAWALAAQADTVTLIPDHDATLYEDSVGAYANGGGDFLFTGRTNGTAVIRRSVLSFDIAGNLPAEAQITDVRLTLHVTRGNGTHEQRLFRVTNSWNEGTVDATVMEGGGATSQTGDVTWIHRSQGTLDWTTPGGDYLPTPSAIRNAPSPNNSMEFSGAGLVTDVKFWLDNPAENFGWLLRATNENFRNTKRFGSRDGDDDFYPTLRITYTAILFDDGFESGDLSGWSEAKP